MKKQHNILVVDDDQAHRAMLRALLAGWGYAVTDAEDGGSAIREARERPYDLILMDIRMLKVSGLEALAAIKAFNPAIPILIMTAYASVETAVEALKQGAYDYLTKPLDFTELRVTMDRAMEHRYLQEENQMLRETLGRSSEKLNLIGRSRAMNGLMETLLLVAPSEATVLLSGESGTGKEMIAGAIHENSPRCKGPFIKINCAAITETLLEAELFGYEQGAFTGADRRKEGRFRQANGGTLLLDEVSEMSPAMQVKLLRVIQEREITRVGGEEVIKIDVRIIAATNRDLDKLTAEGRFREDLYYRLNVVNLEVPPLRERQEDIPLLAQYYLKYFAERNRKSIKGFTPQAMDKLLKYTWPGNVRELINAVERCVVLSRAEYLTEAELLFLREKAYPAVLPAAETAIPGPSCLEEVEKEAVLKMLKLAGGNKSAAARQLGITRRTLHKKLKKYGVM